MSFLYQILKFSIQDFYRNIWLSLATISILVLTLLSINFLVVFDAMAKTAIEVIENKVDISINFKATTGEDEIEGMKKYIINLPEVASVEYISQEQALKKFQQRHQGQTTILEAIEELDSNPLGATLRVKARNLDSYSVILQTIDRAEYNKLIVSKNYDDRQEMISKISGWINTGKKLVLASILFFILISALIVFNTIRVAIYTHREEIGIEKLVGATDWFVSLPFIIESIFYSLISCLITIIIIYPFLIIVQPYITNFFGSGQLDLVNYFNSNFVAIFVSEFLLISLLNILSSFIAIRKYLKV